MNKQEELEGLINDSNHGHILLAAWGLTKYATQYRKELDEEDYDICRDLAQRLITKNMFDSAITLYHAFGLSDEGARVQVINDMRKIFGTSDKMEKFRPASDQRQ